MVNGVRGADERSGRYAEVVFVPQMHPGLVAHFDGSPEVCERRRCAADRAVLGVVRGIGVVEVEDVVVVDAGPGRAFVQDIPDGLEECSTCEPAIG